MVEQLQRERDEQQWAVLGTQDFMDLRDQALAIQSLEQGLYSHLFNLVSPVDIIEIRIAISSFTVVDECITHFVEEFEH
jgi:hypothetical protein